MTFSFVSFLKVKGFIYQHINENKSRQDKIQQFFDYFVESMRDEKNNNVRISAFGGSYLSGQGLQFPLQERLILCRLQTSYPLPTV